MSLVTYLLFRIFTFPLAFLPYKRLHTLGNFFGLLTYYLYPKYRKRALSNIALVHSLPPAEIIALAKQSIQSHTITAFEYPRLSREKNIHKIATCENPKMAAELIQSGTGVIFFCGHQANWELLFLEATTRMSGIAIGRPIKNTYLYNWVVRMREKFGGKIIGPKNAYKESFRALKQGKFVGIVGDQGMLESGFSSPFFGRMAWTSPLPALLSKRTGCPLMVATIRRENGHYLIHYSDPIWPIQEPDDLMKQMLELFEASIKKRPGEWLWIHNRWKQQLPGKLKKRFRHDSVAVIFPDNADFLKFLPRIRELYPLEQLTAFVPSHLTTDASVEVKPYKEEADLLTPDYRFKLVIDFTGNKKVQKHFASLSALNVFAFSHPEEFLADAR